MFSINKNAIVSGDIDYYCFCCDYQIKKFDDVQTHVQDDIHKKNLETTPYSSSFPDEYIRKFDKGYYCTFCNILIPSDNEVELHVLDLKHNQNKGSLLLNRTEDTVLIFNDYRLSEKVWNGIMGLKCLVCNINFENYIQHKMDVSHILNLIQNRVQFGVNNTVYRKIDNNSFHCLTCNNVIKNKEIKKHFNNDHSLKPEPKHDKAVDVKDDNKELEKHEEPKTVAQKNVADEIVSSANNQPAVNKVAANSNQLNGPVGKTKNENSLAVVPYKNEIPSDSFTEKPEDEKQTDENNAKLRNPIDVQAEAVAFAKDNKLTYNWGNKSAYCRICEKKFSSTLKTMKEHVAGKPHKNSVDKSGNFSTLGQKKATLAKQKLEDFDVVEHAATNGVFINEEVCIYSMSFHTISEIGDNNYRCQVCEVNITKFKIDLHNKSTIHRRNMLKTPVLTAYPSEFVREVRPNIFHCGFCNQLEASLESLEDHFKCCEHNVIKRMNEQILERHLPRLRTYNKLFSIGVIGNNPHRFMSPLIAHLLSRYCFDD